MRDRTPKMLDFLGWLSQAQVTKQRPESFRCTVELVNVAARGEEVKYLFVNRGSSLFNSNECALESYS